VCTLNLSSNELENLTYKKSSQITSQVLLLIKMSSLKRHQTVNDEVSPNKVKRHENEVKQEDAKLEAQLREIMGDPIATTAQQVQVSDHDEKKEEESKVEGEVAAAAASSSSTTATAAPTNTRDLFELVFGQTTPGHVMILDGSGAGLNPPSGNNGPVRIGRFVTPHLGSGGRSLQPISELIPKYEATQEKAQATLADITEFAFDTRMIYSCVKRWRN
jgi:hypothetical protein